MMFFYYLNTWYLPNTFVRPQPSGMFTTMEYSSLGRYCSSDSISLFNQSHAHIILVQIL